MMQGIPENKFSAHVNQIQSNLQAFNDSSSVNKVGEGSDKNLNKNSSSNLQAEEYAKMFTFSDKTIGGLNNL